MTINIEQDLREILNKLDTKLDKVSNDVADIKTDLAVVKAKLDAQQKSVDKIPDLAEKVGELKNWRQIAIIIITGTASTIFGWFLKKGIS